MMKRSVNFFLVLFIFSVHLYSQSSPYEITLPYSCGFEDSIENKNWTLNAGTEGPNCADQWMIGNLDYVEGYNSLYISCDTGKTLTYGANPNYVMAYRPIFLSKPDSVTTDRCQINISFEWKGGSNRDVSILNYYLMPDYAIEDYLNSNSNKAALPAAIKRPKAKLYGSDDWQEYSSREGITYDNTFYIVFVWQNNNTNDSLFELSMCIDDIQISTANCPKPTSLTVRSVADTLIVNWDGSHQKYDLEYRVPGMRTWRQHHGLVYEDYTEVKEMIFTGLAEGVYDVRVRGVCGDNEKSAWLTETDIVIFSPDKHCINYVKLANNRDVTCLMGTATSINGGWDASSLSETGLGLDYGFSANAIDYGPKDIRSRHTVNWKQGEYDPRTGNKLRTIPEGSLASVRLGNWEIGAEAEGIIYRYTVDTLTAKIILMKYAVVLEAPGHGPEEDPYFRLRLKDENGKMISTTCGNFEFTPENSDIDWNVYGAYVWKDWTTVGMNIAAYHGQTIEIELVTQDCVRTGHAGYAYFTLDCADAVIKNSSCGDSDVIAIEAPDGFRYEWTKHEDRNTIISTDRKLEVPGSDTTTYYCKVDYIGLNGCGFELSTLVKPRIPYADFDIKWEPQNCQNRVVLTNKSRVRTKVDNVIVDTEEPCETFYWNVNDSQFESQDEDAVYIAAKEGGEISVTLTVGIANDKCLGDTTISFVVPSISDKVDSLYKEKCEADVEYFADQLILADGIYYDEDTTWCGCDSLTVLDLKFMPTPDETYVYDTICSEQGYFFNGKIYNESGVYESWLKTEKLGCDSLVILNLTKTRPIKATISNEYRSVCADETLNINYSYVDSLRHPIRYSLLYNSFAKDAGFNDQTGLMLDNINKTISVLLPDSCRPNKYSVTVVFEDTLSFCQETAIDVDFDVYYSSNILLPKFSNLITVLGSDSNGGYNFVDNEYKWYKNGLLLDGETNSYLFLGKYETFKDGDCFSMEARRVDDGVVMRTCEICPDINTPVVDIYEDDELLQTTIIEKGNLILLENVERALVNIYSLTGVCVNSYNIDYNSAQIYAPNEIGFYIVQIKTKDRNYIYKIWVK